MRQEEGYQVQIRRTRYRPTSESLDTKYHRSGMRPNARCYLGRPNTRKAEIAERTAALEKVESEVVTECEACAQLMAARNLAAQGLA